MKFRTVFGILSKYSNASYYDYYYDYNFHCYYYYIGIIINVRAIMSMEITMINIMSLPTTNTFTFIIRRHTREWFLCACTEEGPCEVTAGRWLSVSQEESPHQKLALLDFDLG